MVQRKFLNEHLGRWGSQFAHQLSVGADGGFYTAVAALLDAFLAEEAVYLRVDPETIRVNTEWRTKISEEGCEPDDCPLAESGETNGNLIQL